MKLQTEQKKLHHLRRIVCVVPQIDESSDQHPGGQLTAARGLLNHLHNKGYSVEVLNTASGSFPPPPLGVKVLKSLKRVVNAFKLFRCGDIAGVILFTGAGLSLLERIVICAVARGFRVRSILFFRNSEILVSGGGALARKWRLFALQIPNKLAVQGERWHEAFFLLGIDSCRVVVIPNWLPPETEKTDIPKRLKCMEPIHFIFVGWLVEAKGLLFLMDAIESLQHRDDFIVTLVGGGSLEQAIRHRIDVSGWKNVQVTGWKSPVEVSDLLASAHVFVLPTHHKEGFPNALLEAMAKGLPGISTDMGAITDSLQDGINGIIIPVKCSKALASAMQSYLDSRELIEKHSRNAIKIIEKRHNLERNCDKLLISLLQ